MDKIGVDFCAFVDCITVQRRLDQARPDGIDAHPVGTQFRRQPGGEIPHRAFRSRVGDAVGSMDEGLDGAEIDDAALRRLQRGQKGMRHIENAVNVYRQHIIPILHGGVGRNLGAAHDTRIVTSTDT